MFNNPNFIMIGSTGRNSGKTEFACRLIKRLASDHKIIGIKITAVDCRQGSCPRGGIGCGVCGSLTDDFIISEEKSCTSGKDTSRMLESGAQQVFWLKADKNHLHRATEALLNCLPANALFICESNTLRSVLEPGLFLVIKNNADHNIKESCQNVLEYADRIIEFSGSGWDYGPERISLLANKWVLKEKATAIILAGGKSSRMGTDKSLLPVHGKPLISNVADQLSPFFDEVIIGANDMQKYAFLNFPVIPDIVKDKGPLMGILSCLKASSNDINFIAACDIPLININLVKKMIRLSADADIVMPVSRNEKYEPLFAIYKKSVIPMAEEILTKNSGKIIELLKYARCQFVDMDNSIWYRNLNKKDDYLNYINELNIIQFNNAG